MEIKKKTNKVKTFYPESCVREYVSYTIPDWEMCQRDWTIITWFFYLGHRI